MVAMKEKRALFGGALRCAGLATAAAITSGAMADFIPVVGPFGAPNYSINYAVGGYPDYTQHVFAYDFNFAGGFPANTATSNTDGDMTAFAFSTIMGAYLSVSTTSQWQNAGAVVQQYFTVGTNKGATVYWDFTFGNLNARVLVYQYGAGTIMDEGAGTSGSQSISLAAGETYLFLARASMTAGFGQFVFASMVWEVPAPGAVALLGLGMLGTRRRRRE